MKDENENTVEEQSNGEVNELPTKREPHRKELDMIVE